MQGLPGFFRHFLSNLAHLSHITGLFSTFFIEFSPPIAPNNLFYLSPTFPSRSRENLDPISRHSTAILKPIQG